MPGASARVHVAVSTPFASMLDESSVDAAVDAHGGERYAVELRSDMMAVLPSGEEIIITSAGVMLPSALKPNAHQPRTVDCGVHCALKVMFGPATSQERQKF